MRGGPHLPPPAAIEAYGKGGFRFADMSHRGSILCLPAGIWAWPVTKPEEITDESLARVFGSGVELFMLGTGKQPWFMPEELRWRFRDASLVQALQADVHAGHLQDVAGWIVPATLAQLCALAAKA